MTNVNHCNRQTLFFVGLTVLALAFNAGCQRASTSTTPQVSSPDSRIDSGLKVPSEVEASISGKPVDLDTMFNTGEYGQAEAEVRRRLLQSPNDPALLFWMGRLKAAQGKLPDAIEALDEIPEHEVEAYVAASGQTAQWCETLEQWDQAILRYQRVLDRVPNADIVLRPLARILNRQGRRIEASPLVAELCRQGNIEEEELRSLITWSHAFASDDPNSSFAAIGPLGKARSAFSLAEYQQVVSQLHPDATQGDAGSYALYGRVLALLQDWSNWTQWEASPVPGCEMHADYWHAVGLHALLHEDAGRSVICFSEAIMLDPTDHTAYLRYSEALSRTGMHDESQRAFHRAELLKKTNEIGVDFARNHRDPDRFAKLANLLDQLDRPFEALAWRAVALAYARDSLSPSDFTRFNGELVLRRQTLSKSNVTATENVLLVGLERDGLRRRFPTQASVVPRPDVSIYKKTDSTPLPISICNVANDVNLMHEFDNENASFPDKHGILQEMGCGVAVTDYDLDGWPDIYLPQASATPMQQDGTKPNLLFRNLGDAYLDVTLASAADDRSFTHGVTAGDINQDGFPDFCIGNVGRNHLLINNGDGTFTQTTFGSTGYPPLWTSSLAIGDLSGDHLPEIVEINYLDDPRAFEQHLSPTQFSPASDRVHFSDGRGEFLTADLGQEPSMGLGTVLADFDGDRRNNLFIANDGRPDRWWELASMDIASVEASVTVPAQALSQSAGRHGVLREQALSRGCSVGFQGLPGASMGIAVDDFNDDGRFDLFVTQFFGEPDVFFLQTESGRFIDRTVQAGMYKPSLKVLGFGTQAIDFDNDGSVEIAVVNGHTARSANPQIPYEMLPQTYRLGPAGAYAVEQLNDPSGYWQTPALGRGLSTLDWNRDGLMDLVVTHLESPTGLLENRTARSHHWLQLRLVGTTTERDAIGAKVTIKTAGGTRYKVVSSGDGYSGKNDAILHVGLADSEKVELQIDWPSGQTSDIRVSDVDRRWIVVEGESEPFEDTPSDFRS